MKDEDEDYAYGLTEIEWNKRQRKDMVVGFTFLGLVILFIIGLTIWFFRR